MSINLENSIVTKASETPADNVSTSGVAVSDNYKKPTPNPILNLDIATGFDALSNPLLSGASTYNSQSLPSLDSPSVRNAVSIPSISTPVVTTSQAIADIVNPSALTSASIPSVNTPSVNTAKTIPSHDTPVVNTAQSLPAINTPSVFTSKGAISNTPPYPLNHARILYDNLLQTGTIASSEAGSNPQLALVPNTFQRWSFTSATLEDITFTLPAAVNMDTFCIGAHNLFFGSVGTRYRFSYSSSDVGAFTVIDDWQDVESNAAGMVHVAPAVSVRRLKLEIEASASREKYVAYISAGVAMQMQRPFFNGHNPYPDSDVTEYYSSRSESGEIIGRLIRRKGFETQAEINNLTDVWYRNYFVDFKNKAKLQPFFMAWNLLEYPKDVAFAETTSDIKAAMQNGSNARRNVSFSYKGV